MDPRVGLLAAIGYQIVWISGAYCRAQREDHDTLFRWDGERWLALG